MKIFSNLCKNCLTSQWLYSILDLRLREESVYEDGDYILDDEVLNTLGFKQYIGENIGEKWETN
jgi:hypothetical protein